MSKANALIDKCLSDYRSNSLIPLEIEAIQRQLEKPDASLEKLKPLTERDPVFCWLAVMRAFEMTKHRASQPFAAAHALSTIGIAEVQQLIKPFKDQKAASLSAEVRFNLTSSLLAAELAENLGQLSLGKPHTRWSALFYQMPDTLLWHLHPKSMWRIYYRRLALPKKISLFEEAKLGFNLRDWRIHVAEKMLMSEHLKLIYALQVPENPREILSYAKNGMSDKTPSIKGWHGQENWLVVLSNRLARAILSPWHPQAFKHHVGLLTQLLYTSEKKLKTEIYQSILSVSRKLKYSDLLIPAVSFLMLPSKPNFPDWLVNKNLVNLNIAQRRKKLAIQDNPRVKSSKTASLSTTLKKLTIEASQFNNSAELIHHGLMAAIKSLGFSRAAFMSVNSKSKLVETKIAIASPNHKKIRPDFSFSRSTPLIKFIEQPTFMHIRKAKHKSAWLKMPQAIQKETSQCVMFSIKPGQQVKAMIYLDADNDAVYSEEKMNQLKLLLKAISKGLSIRNKLRQQRTKKPVQKTGL